MKCFILKYLIIISCLKFWYDWFSPPAGETGVISPTTFCSFGNDQRHDKCRGWTPPASVSQNLHPPLRECQVRRQLQFGSVSVRGVLTIRASDLFKMDTRLKTCCVSFTVNRKICLFFIFLLCVMLLLWNKLCSSHFHSVYLSLKATLWALNLPVWSL